MNMAFSPRLLKFKRVSSEYSLVVEPASQGIVNSKLIDYTFKFDRMFKFKSCNHTMTIRIVMFELVTCGFNPPLMTLF